MNHAIKKLIWSWWLLRITYGILFILVGTDKFLYTLTDWQQFIGNATHVVPLAPVFILKGFALLQISAGILLFTPWLRIGIYLTLVLLVIIFFNLITASSGIVVVAHDLVMIVCVYVLMQLTKILKK